MSTKRDFYEVLGVEKNADDKQIKKALRGIIGYNKDLVLKRRKIILERLAEMGETVDACEEDCTCGNGVCDDGDGETGDTCPEDCPCGDGVNVSEQRTGLALSLRR